MLILIYGADGLRVKERVFEMRQKFLEKFDPTGMNVSEIVVRSASDANIGDMSQQIRSAPFLAPKRMVIIGDLFSVVKKGDVEVWRDLFLSSTEDTIVILFEAITLEKAKKTPLLAALVDEVNVYTYLIETLEGAQLRGWVLERASRMRAVLSSAVADYLIARVGSNVWQLNNELMKLASYANGEAVTREMIDFLCRGTVQGDVFGLLDALGTDPVRALERLSRERSSGAEEFPLFGMLLRQIRLLLAYRLYIERNGSSQGVAQSLGIHPFVAQKLGKEAERFSVNSLQDLHVEAQGLDRSMKRGMSPALAVDRLIADMLKR